MFKSITPCPLMRSNDVFLMMPNEQIFENGNEFK